MYKARRGHAQANRKAMAEMTVHYLSRPGRPKLAYVYTKGAGPLVAFLGGFKSDMNGTKATWLEQQAKARGQAFLRLDYSGHGQSEGAFKDGTIGSWKEDALAVIEQTDEKEIILVGSSMGGWISLLILREHPELIKGFVGIAAAPDFTKEIYARFTKAQRAAFERDGFLEEPNDYSPEPYIFTRGLLEESRAQMILDQSDSLKIPMRLVQGKKDTEVDWHMPERIQAAFPQADIRTTLIEDGDHRLSWPSDLQIIDDCICELSKK